MIQYQSYLLRLWRADAGSAWRGSLQSTATGETQAFDSLLDLVVFLVATLDQEYADRALAELAAELQTH